MWTGGPEPSVADMTTTTRTPAPVRPARPTYWLATGVFGAIFAFSGVWTLVDPAGASIATEALDYPGWIVVPQGIAKLLGLAAILSRRSRLLTGLAFAGFFYDVLLALVSHVVHADWPGAALATVGLTATVAAFLVHRDRFWRPGAP